MSIQIPTSPETNINFIYYPVELRDKAHYKENTEKCLVVLVAQLCPTLQLHGLWPARLLCPWDSPGKNTGLDCHSLLQKMFTELTLNELYPLSP